MYPLFDASELQQLAVHAQKKVGTLVILYICKYLLCAHICQQYCSALLHLIAGDSGSTMLNDIVDNYEQCGQHNIVASCLQQP